MQSVNNIVNIGCYSNTILTKWYFQRDGIIHLAKYYMTGLFLNITSAKEENDGYYFCYATFNRKYYVGRSELIIFSKFLNVN